MFQNIINNRNMIALNYKFSMKKILIAGVIVLAAVVAVSTVSAAFEKNLSVGSTGADVSALQTLLINKGFDIPAISAGTAQKGYFGGQTLAAVKAYQGSMKLPTTGFVGPLTRAALNGTSAVASTMTLPFPCPAGYVAPVGWTCPGTTPVVTPGATTTVSMTGTDGSVSVSDSSYVSSGQTIKKGESKDVVAVKLQATAGPVTVTRVDAHFSVRPWLFFSQATLKDSTGRVLAVKPLMSASDATEITVGQDYLVRFEGLNYMVAPGVNPDLAVGVTVLVATDKITANSPGTVYVHIPSGAIRTINGLGITDSVGGTIGSALTAVAPSSSGAGARSFTLSATGNIADISTRVSPNAPASQVSQVISATVATNNVELGIFSLKSSNNSSTVQALNVLLKTDPAFAMTGLFSNVRLVDGATTYGALSFTDAGTATFSNLNIPLSQDVWKDLRVVADVAATSSTVKASTTLDASTINAIDSTYTQANVGGATYTSATNDQTSANTQLTTNSMSLGANSATLGTGIVDAANGPVQRYPVTYTFTLINNSSNSLYISSDVSTVLGTTTSNSNASSTITAFFPTPTPVAGDVSGAYIIPAGGGSRTFTVTGTIKKSSNSSSSETLSVNRITYGPTTAGTGSTITTGLERLSVLAPF